MNLSFASIEKMLKIDKVDVSLSEFAKFSSKSDKDVD
jgi:hypothetical protein